MSVEDDLPLTGIKVADFTAALAGPLATMCLGDLGADVLKIEDAENGEMARLTAPWIFVAFNRNKRSLGLNLREEEGREIARQIALDADVVASSFRPGVMASFGLGAAELMEAKPSLIYARLAGYAEEGPKAHRRGMDLTIRAESGLIASGNLKTPGIALVDYAAGMMLAQAIMAAIIRRDRTGRGSVIDSRLLDTGVFLQSVPIAELSATGAIAEVMSSPTAGVFQTSDGEIVIAVYYDRDFERLCEAIGSPELAADPRFGTRPDRQAHAEVLGPLVRAALVTKTRAEWIELFDRVGVMVGSVLSMNELFEDPQLAYNQSFEDVPAGGGPSTRLVRLPYSFDGRPLPIVSPSPALNAHGAEVLRGLGRTDAEIASLAERGIVTS